MAISYADASGSNNLGTAIGHPSTAGDEKIINGSQVYDDGLDISSVRYALVWAKDSVTIGSEGESMTIDCSGATDQFIMESTNRVYVAAGGIGGEIQTAIVRRADRGVWFTGGDVVDAIQQGGKATFGSSCDVQNFKMTNGEVTIKSHASDTLDSVDIQRGEAKINRSFTGTTGTCVVGAAARLYTDNRDMTIEDIVVEGYWKINNGDIGSCEFKPGTVLDFGDLEADIDLGDTIVWPGVKIDRWPPAGVSVTKNSLTNVGDGSPGPWN